MNCPRCKSSKKKKNGFRRGKQCYKCKDCGCQYVQNPKPRSYPNEVKQLCLKMYLNGMGFRAIALLKEQYAVGTAEVKIVQGDRAP